MSLMDWLGWLLWGTIVVRDGGGRDCFSTLGHKWGKKYMLVCLEHSNTDLSLVCEDLVEIYSVYAQSVFSEYVKDTLPNRVEITVLVAYSHFNNTFFVLFQAFYCISAK